MPPSDREQRVAKTARPTQFSSSQWGLCAVKTSVNRTWHNKLLGRSGEGEEVCDSQQDRLLCTLCLIAAASQSAHKTCALFLQTTKTALCDPTSNSAKPNSTTGMFIYFLVKKTEQSRLWERERGERERRGGRERERANANCSFF